MQEGQVEGSSRAKWFEQGSTPGYKLRELIPEMDSGIQAKPSLTREKKMSPKSWE